MYEQLYRDRIGFARDIAKLVNGSNLPAFVKLDILAAVHKELMTVAAEEERNALEEVSDADTPVSENRSDE